MRSLTNSFLIVGALVASVGLGSTSTHGSGNSDEHHGSMMDMTSMMEQMSAMMDGCSRMMQSATNGGSQPNEQWRRDAPVAPGTNG